MSTTDNEPAGFEQQIKRLFRERDRDSMKSRFDLWDYDDVSRNADAILGAVRAGKMPCDGPWPEAKVDVLQQWVESGKAP